jgi:hypothetical protein
MSEPDLSGIDPLRVPEARRRIASLNEYLALPDPTTADAKRISAKIGLSPWYFQRLARIWSEHRNPAMIVVSRRGPSNRDYGVDPRAAAIVRQEIEKAGSNAELATVAPQIERRCRSENVIPPARATIWNHIRKAQAATGVAAGPPRLIIGRMWFHLPVTELIDGWPGSDMPTLLVVVALPERIILAHRISVDERYPPSVADLVTDLVPYQSTGAQPRPLLMDAADRRAARNALATSGLGGIRPHKRSLQRQLARAFGGRLGSLSALYQRSLARPESKRIVQRQDERISPEAAQAVIRDAVQAHNLAAADSPPEFTIADELG